MMNLLILEGIGEKLEDTLQEQGLGHLHVRKHGTHLVIYSMEEGERTNRARFSLEKKGRLFQLGVANSSGRWEETPYTGTARELLALLVDQFPFVLDEF
jgi:hypothetical protein